MHIPGVLVTPKPTPFPVTIILNLSLPSMEHKDGETAGEFSCQSKLRLAEVYSESYNDYNRDKEAGRS